MTPEEAIDMLDSQLRTNGMPITLVRMDGTSANIAGTANCSAWVRNFKPNELVGNVIQGDKNLVLSPTDLDAEAWPPPIVGQTTPADFDPRVPRRGDRVRIMGQTFMVIGSDPLYIGTSLVRVNVQIRGGGD